MKYVWLVLSLLIVFAMTYFGTSILLPAIGIAEPVCGWESYPWYGRLIGLVCGPLILWSAWSILKETL
jgi:hypothetical protein